MSLYIKNAHMTITHSPCCPILNVAEIMLLYVINVTLHCYTYTMDCQWCHRKRPLEKAPRVFIASVVAFWKDPENFYYSFWRGLSRWNAPNKSCKTPRGLSLWHHWRSIVYISLKDALDNYCLLPKSKKWEKINWIVEKETNRRDHLSKYGAE